MVTSTTTDDRVNIRQSALEDGMAEFCNRETFQESIHPNSTTISQAQRHKLWEELQILLSRLSCFLEVCCEVMKRVPPLIVIALMGVWWNAFGEKARLEVGWSKPLGSNTFPHAIGWQPSQPRPPFLPSTSSFPSTSWRSVFPNKDTTAYQQDLLKMGTTHATSHLCSCFKEKTTSPS